MGTFSSLFDTNEINYPMAADGGIMTIHQGRAFGRNSILMKQRRASTSRICSSFAGSEARWYHPGKGSAVGRHSGQENPTTISSWQDGVSRLDKIAWVPNWPRNPARRNSLRGIFLGFQNLKPALPAGDVSVKVSVRAGRGKAAVVQMPHATMIGR